MSQVFRYNAELDSKCPRPVSSVIKDLEEWEKQQEWKNAPEDLPLEKTFPSDSNISPMVNSNFEFLIEQAKRTFNKSRANFCNLATCEETNNNDNPPVFTQKD